MIAYDGRSSLKFFSANLNTEKGSTAPEALPTDTIVPLRLMSLKLLSNLPSISSSPIIKTKNLRVLSNTIKDSVYTHSIREFQHPLYRVLNRVENNMISSVRFGKLRLCRRRGRPNDGSPNVLRQLGEQETQTPCGGMNEYGITLLDRVRLLDETDGC